jgi:CRP-like cAMP-binding protein
VADGGLAELAGAAQIRHLKASQRLYKMGDKNSILYCLLSVRVRLSTIDRLGQAFVLSELEPSYWLDAASLEPDNTRIQEARAQAATDVMLLP